MRSLSNKKGQFFILTTVVIVGVLYTLSKSISPYSSIDTSRVVSGDEIFFFNNVKNKTVKTIGLSDSTTIQNNLVEYKKLVEEMSNKKGYSFVFNYTIDSAPNTVTLRMLMMSEKYTLFSEFNELYTP